MPLLDPCVQDRPTAEVLLRQELGRQDRGHLSTVCQEMGCDPQSTIGLGLWGDGVPYNYDRSASVDIFSLNFPGFGDDHPLKDTRIPLVAMDHKHVVKGKTFDDILEIIAWSLFFWLSVYTPQLGTTTLRFIPGVIGAAFRRLAPQFPSMVSSSNAEEIGSS